MLARIWNSVYGENHFLLDGNYFNKHIGSELDEHVGNCHSTWKKYQC